MSMPIGVRIFIAVEPVDLRVTFYRLTSHVRGVLERDPQTGHLYVFLGKRRPLVTILILGP